MNILLPSVKIKRCFHSTVNFRKQLFRTNLYTYINNDHMYISVSKLHFSDTELNSCKIQTNEIIFVSKGYLVRM